MKNKLGFRLIVITDRKLCKEKLLVSIIRQSVRNGVKTVQLREKDLTSNELLALARKIKKIRGVKLIINGRLDIVVLSKAYGVHSPENGIDVKFVKKLVLTKVGNYSKLIAGKSVHSFEQAVKAERDGYDYLIFGPVFKTPAKVKYGPPQDLNKLKKVCESVDIPVYAVGGITPQRARKCLNAGAYGIAVIRAIMKSKNIARTVGEFKTAMGSL